METPDETIPSLKELRSHSLYIKIVTAFVGLLLISLCCVVFYNYRSNSHVVLKLSNALMDRAAETVLEKSKSYLQPAAAMVEISARTVQDVSVPFGDPARLESFGIEVLRAYPQVAMFYLGDEQGNFFMLARQPDGTIATQIIEPGRQPNVARWRYRDRDLRVVRETTEADPYDPRTRPWYKGAKQTRGLFWTDVYLFYTGNVPGITCAYPALGPDGQVRGVFGVDIQLGELSRFLRTLNVGPSGLTLVLNENDEVLAYSGTGAVVTAEGNKPRAARFGELDVPQVRAVAKAHANRGNDRGTVRAAFQRYVYTVRQFPVALNRDWRFVIIVAENDFVGDVKVANRIALVIGVVVLVISVFMAMRLSRSIARPVVQLTEEANRIRDFHLEGAVVVHSKIREIEQLGQAVAAMKSSLQAFQKYVPSDLVRQLVQTGEQARLGGHKRELTVFFSDIQGFTPISEGMTAEQLMIHLSEYLDEITRIILQQRGTVDKYIGDAIMAFWGAPVANAQHALHACDAALRCQEKIAGLNERWTREGKPPLVTRIGIHTGEVVVGNLGSSERMNYTVLGDNVNFANRLEGANRFFGTRILISQSTFEKVSGSYLCRPLGMIAVRGKTVGVAVHELIARNGSPPAAEWERFCAEFGRGVQSYQDRAWDKALEVFTRLAGERPDDMATQLYLTRCRQFLASPSAADWMPVEFLESK